MPKQKKDKTFTSEDLKLNRHFNVKLKTVNIYQPEVVEINISFFAIPHTEREITSYETSIRNIEKKYNRMCSNYVRNNVSFLDRRYINDFNFTSTNLRKNYNKYVTMSLYVKQKENMSFTQFQSKIKNSLKGYLEIIHDKLTEEEFVTTKTKRTEKPSTK